MSKNICVVGLGYVGMPLAALCAIKGYKVVGLDTNKIAVNKINQGLSHIKDVEVERLVKSAHLTGRLKATTDVKELSSSSTYLICVPTPVGKNQDPDLLPLYSAIDTIAPFIKKEDLVVVLSLIHI